MMPQFSTKPINAKGACRVNGGGAVNHSFRHHHTRPELGFWGTRKRCTRCGYITDLTEFDRQVAVFRGMGWL